MGDFTGKLNGKTYDDAALFGLDAKASGYRTVSQPRMGGKWRTPGHRAWVERTGTQVGADVYDAAGNLVGQVWANHPDRGYVWVALETGRCIPYWTGNIEHANWVRRQRGAA